jgi:hypothetical protein
MFCSAFRRDGHPCRGYGQPTEHPKAPLCHLHRDFYSNRKPTDIIERLSSMDQSYEERQWMIRMARNPHFKWQPDAIDHIKSLWNRDMSYLTAKAGYIYDTYVKAKLIPPLTLPQIWQWRVRRQINTLRVSDAETPLPPYYRRLILDVLAPYFYNANPVTTLPYLLSRMSTAHPQTDISGQMWREIIETTTAVAPNRIWASYPIEDFIKSIDTKLRPFPAAVWWTQGLREFTKALLEGYRDAERGRLARRIEPFKEGVIAEAWHPRRVAQWLDAGLELEDL